MLRVTAPWGAGGAVCQYGQHPGLVGLSVHLLGDAGRPVPGKHLFSSYSVSSFCKEPRLVVWPWTKLWQQFISIETALSREIGSFSLKCHWYCWCHSCLGHPKDISVCFQGDFCGFLFTNDVPWLPVGFGSLSQGWVGVGWCVKLCSCPGHIPSDAVCAEPGRGGPGLCCPRGQPPSSQTLSHSPGTGLLRLSCLCWRMVPHRGNRRHSHLVLPLWAQPGSSCPAALGPVAPDPGHPAALGGQAQGMAWMWMSSPGPRWKCTLGRKFLT